MARLIVPETRKSDGKQAAARAERQIAVEQRFGIAAEQVFVARLSDAEIERIEPALAALAHQVHDELFARALDGERTLRDRIEHGAETSIADHAAHGGDDDVVDRQRIKFDRRRTAGVKLGGRRLDETPHAGRGENVLDAERAHARRLLLEKGVEHPAHFVGIARARKAHRAIVGQRLFLFAHLFARRAVGARAEQRREVRHQRAAESEICRALMRQQREGIGSAGPGQRLIDQLDDVGAPFQAVRAELATRRHRSWPRPRAATGPC